MEEPNILIISLSSVFLHKLLFVEVKLYLHVDKIFNFLVYFGG